MAIDPYLNESERANRGISDDFELKKTSWFVENVIKRIKG